MTPFELYSFLNARPIPTGQARMLMPDLTVRAVSEIPPWYWARGERIVAHAETGLRGELLLFTYFTCEEEPDGTLFHTAYSSQDDFGDWTVIAQSATAQEAREKHAAIRAAWWVGSEQYRLPSPGEGVQLRPGYAVPVHPYDAAPR